MSYAVCLTQVFLRFLCKTVPIILPLLLSKFTRERNILKADLITCDW